MIACDYECPHHGRFEILEDREAAIDRDCPTCGQPSPYCFPAPAVTAKLAEATQGRSSKPAGFLSTSEIADGRMSVGGYKAEISKRRKERIRRHVRSKLGE